LCIYIYGFKSELSNILDKHRECVGYVVNKANKWKDDINAICNSLKNNKKEV